jgi:Skp family chaperone for outer membrane proteins
MNKIYTFVISFFVCVSIASVNGIVFSKEEVRQIKFGIVDADGITRQALLAKDIARKIDSMRRKFMSEIKKEEIVIRAFDDELKKKRIILSPAALDEEVVKLRLKTSRLRKKVQVRNKELLKFRSVAEQYLKSSIQKALREVIKIHDYNLVLRYTPQLILAYPKYLDISKLVLEQLNKNTSKYVVPVEIDKTVK